MTVVVLSPPPVPPGDAPMNIKIIVRKLDASLIDAISTVLNPAVLGVTDIKNASRIRLPSGVSLSV